MKDWITQAIAFVRGARQGPVGVKPGIIVCETAKSLHVDAGNASTSMLPEAVGFLPSAVKVMK